MRKKLLYLGLLAPLYGQDPLSLRDAVRVALSHNKSIEAAGAARQAAGARIQQAKSGWLPRLNYSESVTRGDNPVFVFGSLLTQHQFTERNFGIGALNRPHALNNFQSQLNLDQVIYDAGQARNDINSTPRSTAAAPLPPRPPARRGWAPNAAGRHRRRCPHILRGRA